MYYGEPPPIGSIQLGIMSNEVVKESLIADLEPVLMRLTSLSVCHWGITFLHVYKVVLPCCNLEHLSIDAILCDLDPDFSFLSYLPHLRSLKLRLHNGFAASTAVDITAMVPALQALEFRPRCGTLEALQNTGKEFPMLQEVRIHLQNRDGYLTLIESIVSDSSVFPRLELLHLPHFPPSFHDEPQVQMLRVRRPQCIVKAVDEEPLCGVCARSLSGSLFELLCVC